MEGQGLLWQENSAWSELYRPLKLQDYSRMDVWSAAWGWDRSECLLWVSLHPVNVTEVDNIWPICRAALKQKNANLLDISGKLTVKKLPLSFTIIILRNGASRFMHTDRYMCWRACVCVCERERRSNVRKGWKENGGSDTENRVVFFFKCRPLCLCVGLWVCAQFSNPVHVWVCQNSARLPSSSHCSRFVSLQLQVTKWHCAFMAALHGASHKPWND